MIGKNTHYLYADDLALTTQGDTFEEVENSLSNMMTALNIHTTKQTIQNQFQQKKYKPLFSTHGIMKQSGCYESSGGH